MKERSLSMIMKKRCVALWLIFYWNFPVVKGTSWDSGDASTGYLSTLSTIVNSLGMNSSVFHDWFLNDNYCNFTGISCDGNEDIIGLDLRNMQLSGTLPSNIQELFYLERLLLGYNRIGGTISLQLPPTLIDIDLQHNQLTGTIPDMNTNSFFFLRRLILDDNWLSGTIPNGLCDLTNLRVLQVSNNIAITGSIPECFGRHSQLQVLQIRDCSLTGPIPNSLCVPPDTQPGLCGRFEICQEGFYQYNSVDCNSTLSSCRRCPVPSNVLANSKCRWIENSRTRSNIPSLMPSDMPSLIPSGVKSMNPSPFQAVGPSISVTPSFRLTVLPSTTNGMSPAPSGERNTLFPSYVKSSEPASISSLSSGTTQPTYRLSLFLPTNQPTEDVSSASPTPCCVTVASAMPSFQPSPLDGSVKSILGSDSTRRSKSKNRTTIGTLPAIGVFVVIGAALILVTRLRPVPNKFVPLTDEGYSSSVEERQEDMESGNSKLSLPLTQEEVRSRKIE